MWRVTMARSAACAQAATVAAAVVVLLLVSAAPASAGPCAALGDCNSHGKCIAANKTCECFDGWGSASDVSVYKAADCSKRACAAA